MSDAQAVKGQIQRLLIQGGRSSSSVVKQRPGGQRKVIEDAEAA